MFFMYVWLHVFLQNWKKNMFFVSFYLQIHVFKIYVSSYNSPDNER